MAHHRRTAQLALALSIAVGSATTLAACGSSKSTTAKPTGTSPAARSKSGSAPIVIGTIGSFSGLEASTLGPAKPVMQAWAASVNARGGLDGHPVKLIVEDDANNPTTALADAKQLVNVDHVVAIVGDFSNSDLTWGTVAQSAGVPVIGGTSLDLPFITNPDFFAQGTNTVAGIYALMKMAEVHNGPNVALLYCAEAPQCKQAVGLSSLLAKAAGAKIVYTASVSATAPDYTAVCQGVKSSGAGSVYIADNSAITQRIADACAQQGVTAKELAPDSTVGLSWATDKAFDGTLIAAYDFPFSDRSSSAAIKEFRQAVKTYEPAAAAGINALSASAWDSGQLLRAAVRAAGSGPVTSQSIKRGLYHLKGETLEGLAPPLTYVAGRANPISCYFTMGISNGALTEPKGLQTACAPPAAIGKVIGAVQQSAG